MSLFIVRKVYKLKSMISSSVNNLYINNLKNLLLSSESAQIELAIA